MARLFFGVPLQSAPTLALEAVRTGLPAQRGWRWLAAPNWHITLSFLGDTDGKWINPLVELGERVAHESKAGELTLDSLQWWPSSARPRLLAAVAEQAPSLQPIRKLLNAGLRELGLPFDSKPLRAHVTLMRLERGVLPDDLSLPECAVKVSAESLALFVSEKSAGEKRYRPLWEQALQQTPQFNFR
jgi:2'-5' RNA ligase